MNLIIVIFYVLSFIVACIVGFILYRKLPSKNEKLKLIIPVLISIAIAVVCYLIGLQVPRISFGRFM